MNFNRSSRSLHLAFTRCSCDSPLMKKSSASVTSSLRADQAVRRGPAVRFLVDGCPVDAFEGESVAAALFVAGRRELRRSPRDQAPRGMFCLMGSCQECLVWVEGRKLPACQVPAAAGMEIESLGFREQRLG